MTLLCRHSSHEIRKPIKVSNLSVVLLLLVFPVRMDLKINTKKILFLDVCLQYSVFPGTKITQI